MTESSRETAKPLAEPALSAEHIEQIRRAYDGSKVMNSLCRMALSSLTARSDIEALQDKIKVLRAENAAVHRIVGSLTGDA